jgi:hypothetical protein
MGLALNADPTLSVVVTIVEGGECLRDFLGSITSLDDPPPMQIIVPFDDSAIYVPTIRDQFPGVEFLDLGRLSPTYPIASAAGQHELYDRRRAAGLAAATSEIVAILEDRGQPRPDWARAVISLHNNNENNVIGGAIQCRDPIDAVSWALYVVDFGRYALPFESGPAAWVSDVNVSYTRKALDDTQHLWKDRFHEPIVHSFLIDQGEELFLSNELVVNHFRPPVALSQLISERFHWGRLYGYIRTNQFSVLQRNLFILAGPLIPPVLWIRHGRMQARRGRGLRTLRAFPFIVILTTAWAIGEVWGCITRTP